MDRYRPPSSKTSNDLCNDIIVEILSWLPVDSLLRCKSVSKSWFSLITNPRFVKLHIVHHHSLTAATQIHSPTKIMFISDKHYSMKSMDEVIVSSSSSSVIEKLEMVYPFDFPKPSTVEILGSCNGLICLHTWGWYDNSNTLWIWNPSTKEFKELPFQGHDDVNASLSYGFGYDHVTDDYKVIASVHLFSSTDELANEDHDMYNKEEEEKLHNIYRYEVEVIMVYTLGTNAWRKIQGKQPYKFEYVYRPYPRFTTWTYVNGAFHRIALRPLSKCRILCFDIVDEVYRELPEPECIDGSYEWELTVLKGCLCLSGRRCRKEFKDKQSMEVWMMMDYGVKESWTKIFSVTNGVDFYRLKPMWLCKNGEVVMKRTSELVIYDPKHIDEIKWLKLSRSNVGDKLRFETTTYAGSLVSLKSQ